MRGPQRVFLSHTSDLAEPPNAWTFVAAARSAVERVGDAVVDMESFAASHLTADQVCRELVRSSDVLVVIAGRYFGSTVPDRPETSYVELEFDVAGEASIPRIAVLLDEDPTDPTDERQLAFRARLRHAGVVATVGTPDALETEVLHALTARDRPGHAGPSGSITVHAYNSSNIQAGHGSIQHNYRHDTGRGRQRGSNDGDERVPGPASRNRDSIWRRLQRRVDGLLDPSGNPQRW